MYRLLAGSCDSGPCPNFYVDDADQMVKVQGYRTSAPDVAGQVPENEDFVAIPAQDWATLLSRLPLRMLLRALMAKPGSRRPVTSAAMAAAGR